MDQRDTAFRIVGELLLQGWLHLIVELRHVDMLVDNAVRKLMAALFVGVCLFAVVTCIGMLVGKSGNLRLFTGIILRGIQYLRPDLFSSVIKRSIQYIVMYDGTCYKIVDGKYCECKLEGGEDYFTNIYIGQPYEVDANQYAYELVKKVCGDSDDLRKLYEFWMPSQPVPDDVYDSLYALIDEKIQLKD